MLCLSVQGKSRSIGPIPGKHRKFSIGKPARVEIPAHARSTIQHSFTISRLSVG